jgi:hypothetical protein
MYLSNIPDGQKKIDDIKDDEEEFYPDWDDQTGDE